MSELTLFWWAPTPRLRKVHSDPCFPDPDGVEPSQNTNSRSLKPTPSARTTSAAPIPKNRQQLNLPCSEPLRCVGFVQQLARARNNGAARLAATASERILGTQR